MRSRTQAYSTLIAARVAEIAERKGWLKPDGSLNYLTIAGAMTIALGRYYHPMSVSRLLNHERGDLKADEVEAWNTIAELTPKQEAEAWLAAGIIPPGSPLDAVQELLDARRRTMAAPADAPFARRRAERRRGGGTTSPAATEAPRPPAGGGTVMGHLRACGGPAAFHRAALTDRSRTAHDAESAQVEQLGAAA